MRIRLLSAPTLMFVWLVFSCQNESEFQNNLNSEIKSSFNDVSDGTLSSDNANTNPIYNRATSTITTVFDISRFNNASELSVARTILHEAVHAYLVTWRVKASSFDELMNTYPMLIQDYGDLQIDQAQHNEMMRTFVQDIGLSLREYGRTKGYNLPDQFYFDLAWGGLTHVPIRDSDGVIVGRDETSWFKALNPDPQVRKRIDDVINVEQSGKDFYGNAKTQMGKNAGC